MTNHPLDSDSATKAIAGELKLPPRQVLAVVELLDAGNTIPFIARYRKEATQGLDEVALRAIEDALERTTTLAARKTTVLKSIAEQELLTDELRRNIDNCPDLRSLEAIYLPFKPKRRTRATIAREQGLQPLADLLLRQEKLQRSKQDTLRAYVNPDQGVPDCETALQGALDIIAEQWSEDSATRTSLVEQAMSYGKVASKVKRGKKGDASKFELYVDHQEPVARIPSHRMLAMLRGASEGILRVGLQLEESQVVSGLKRRFVHNRQFEFYNELAATVDDCYQRLLLPATESTVLQTLKEKADEEAISVFGKNLRELLMAAPAGPRVTIGIDPGFRTGCKVAVVDGTGKFLANTTIYPTPPRSDTATAGSALLGLIDKFNIELIAIGNGTASRETDAFVAALIRDHQLDVTKVMVSEAGASIYSASELAAKEFPDLDVTVRGAISIARRLQDPLAELVKSDPKSIGVGQYQHDVNQPLLRKCLDRVVESCVNNVGVDLNMASVPLLSYVAGIGPKLADNIVEYRNSNGRFTSRKQLTSVSKLGKKAFEQAAGFLRIRGGDQPLDNSAVHPESYAIVSRMAKTLGADAKTLVGNATLSQKLSAEEFVDGKFGIPTIVDIISELGKPGRDPRSEFRVVTFNESVNSMEDLRSGLVLEGVITNVTHFGAFIDIGVHQDALIHISQLADEFVKDPNEVVSVGDIARVKVLEVDIPQKTDFGNAEILIGTALAAGLSDQQIERQRASLRFFNRTIMQVIQNPRASGLAPHRSMQNAFSSAFQRSNIPSFQQFCQEPEPMAEDHVLTETELNEQLAELPGWEVRDNWLRRTFTTPGWPHTVMLVSTIGYLAEAAWHHPDLSVGYAKVTVKLQTHRVRAITWSDVELARRIQEIVLWKPSEDDALDGFPKRWVH